MSGQRIATRDAYGDELMELGKAYPNLVVVDADIGKSCKTTAFAKAFPAQHVNVGIAEQSAACVAAGMALCGKLPFITTYAVFGSMRMLEQLRQSVCYDNLNVKIICSHGGLTPANDGASHQCIEDMGILRAIPNMAVVMGADYHATRSLVRAAAAYPGPVYIRLTRDPVDVIYAPGDAFEIGKAVGLREGEDLTIIANGDLVCMALKAADALAAMGLRAGVLDIHTIKPLDDLAVGRALKGAGRVITLEDHNVIGGLGSAVCEVAARAGKGKVLRMGVQDRFGQSGPYEQLLKDNGISVEDIVSNARALMDEDKEG